MNSLNHHDAVGEQAREFGAMLGNQAAIAGPSSGTTLSTLPARLAALARRLQERKRARDDAHHKLLTTELIMAD